MENLTKERIKALAYKVSDTLDGYAGELWSGYCQTEDAGTLRMELNAILAQAHDKIKALADKIY